MSFEPVHIHSTKRSSFNHLVLLFVPALIFIAVVAYFFLNDSRGQVSGAKTILCEFDQNCIMDK
jgi:cbb3-type cytochrome oxidase subunit 3